MKKTLVFLLVLVLAFSWTVPTMAATDFVDMPEDYSTSALEAAVANGLLMGSDGLILPNDYLTRAQMATIVNRAFGATDKASLEAYVDVPANEWYFDEIAKAVQMKTLNGYINLMTPNACITREQAFAVLARAINLPDGNSEDLAAFVDKGMVSSWAVGPVAAMVKAGYVQGANGRINPTAYVTRKDFAVLMDNIIKNYITTAGEVTSVATGSVMINTSDVTLKNVTVSGDLIIGDGAGDGDVTLDNVIVEGRTILRGCGVNTFKITGNSGIDSIIVSKVKGDVRVSVEENAKVNELTVIDGQEEVIVEGKVSHVEYAAKEAPLLLQHGEFDKVSITEDDAIITIGTGTAVGTVIDFSAASTIKILDAKVDTFEFRTMARDAVFAVENGGTVNNVFIYAENTTITGNGKVFNVAVNANNATINTSGTKIKVAESVTGTTAGGESLEGGVTNSTDRSTGGGGHSTTSYKYNVSIGSFAGGSVSADITRTNEDDQLVTLTVTPNDGYKLKGEIQVMCGGEPIDVEDNTFSMNGEGTYIVTAEFIAPLNSMDVFIVNDEASFNRAKPALYPTEPESVCPANIATDPWLAVVIKRDESLDTKVQLANVTIKKNSEEITGKTLYFTEFGSAFSAYLGNPVTPGEDALNNDTKSGNYEVTIEYEGVTYTKSVSYEHQGENAHNIVFKNGGATVVSYIAKATDSVSVPTAPVVNGKKFVGWYNGEERLEGNTFTVPNDDVTIQARYVDVTAQSVALRGEGPAEGITGNFDYAAAYAGAGVTLEGSTYKVNQAKLLEWSAASDPEDQAKINALTHEINSQQYLFVGLEFTKPENANSVKVKIADGDTNTYDLTTDSASVYNGQYIGYFAISDANGGHHDDRQWKVELEWYNAENILIAATEVNVGRETARV